MNLLAAGAGGVVGLVLALVGGGGSILAVPLLVYVVGVTSTHAAIGTGAIAVAGSAIAGLLAHARHGTVKWRCATVFSLAGMAGALAGSSLAKLTDGMVLLTAFAGLMIAVGAATLAGRDETGDPQVRLTGATAPVLAPRLAGGGFAVGALSGFFGIGGGFLIVPALMAATGMPLANAIGTSLVAVLAFGATTAGNYAVSGYVDWALALTFVAGGAAGGVIGAALSRYLTRVRGALRIVFALIVIVAGLYVLWQGILGLGVVF